METSREEILALSEANVDSTTPEKVLAKKSKNANQIKRAKIAVAKDRAKSLLSCPAYAVSSGTDDDSASDEEVGRLRKQVLVLEKQLLKKELQKKKSCKRTHCCSVCLFN
jgi:hypothetical protein